MLLLLPLVCFFLYFCGRYNSALHRFAGLLLLLLLLRSRALRQSGHRQLRSGWFSREMCLTLVSTLQFFVTIAFIQSSYTQSS